MAPNKALIMAKHPVGFPVAGEDLIVTETSFDLNSAPPAGGLILKTNSISYDPYLRGKMRPNANSYVPSFKPGEALNNNAISTVIKSDNPRFKEGDVVIGGSNFQEYVAVPKERADKGQEAGGISILENPLGLDPQLFLGALGMSGLTAYSSFYEIGKPKKGETIFISAASGAVGQIVGQLAKHEGLKVLGSVGSDEKLKFIKEELGFDGGFNYKTKKPDEALKRLLAEVGSSGLDIYYDNVGGEQLDTSIMAMNNFGRIGEYPLFWFKGDER
jgi:NADPH-dependent curcumin reductase CurA